MCVAIRSEQRCEWCGACSARTGSVCWCTSIAVNQYTGQSETQTKPVCAASIWWNPCTNLIVYELVGLAQISCV
ncbi:hypothetical protein L873DRAFT_1054434 [Choiromyces venosus 120613-1]|uniref:Uncharacterized protein n=1 Tax=Choiromyces venosus 120613-1 TaxID=1336337 RepID=A0A3N4JMX9_9PEZI|nr:hypothetical protein L873DRAFT_1054434 [Choiromyces venosus 120613-1]